MGCTCNIHIALSPSHLYFPLFFVLLANYFDGNLVVAVVGILLMVAAAVVARHLLCG